MASVSTPVNYFRVSGSCYRFEKLLQERPHLSRLRSGQKSFILKDVPKEILDNFNQIVRPELRQSPYIRVPCDTVPGKRILVYEYLSHDFLALAKNISVQARKKILKDSLRGLAELNARDIVTFVTSRSALSAGDRYIKGMLAGVNDSWRSPEAHLRGGLDRPTDMFSFGVVCIYAMLGRVIFGADDDFKRHEDNGALPLLIRLQRQVSYFGNEAGVSGLIKHVSDDEMSCQILSMLWEARSDEEIGYRPFETWPDVDPEFKDLIQGLTSLDPGLRISAQQALEHSWFGDVE
ncbi:putative calcium/calmodulin dependent protein kinase [Aspergillus unguis]